MTRTPDAADPALVAFLEAAGLGHHAARFAEARIDLAMLDALTEADPRQPPARGDEALSVAEGQGERRQISAVFCDLVGSTEISQILDPEDMQDLLRAYRDMIGATVSTHGGHVSSFSGDGVLIAFGFPRAFDDSAVRAVRAALEIVEGSRGLAPPVPGGGCGCASAWRRGPAWWATSSATARWSATAWWGETLNLAARIQAHLETDTVLICPVTRMLVERDIAVAEAGSFDFKGFAHPVTCWRVAEGRAPGEAAEPGGGEAPLLGIDRPLSQLLAAWRAAAAGRGGAVAVSGAPGTGKSTLLKALEHRIAGEAHRRIGWRCSPYSTNTAFQPVISELRTRLGLEPGGAGAADPAAIAALAAPAALDPGHKRALPAPLLLGSAAEETGGLALGPAERRSAVIDCCSRIC